MAVSTGTPPRDLGPLFTLMAAFGCFVVGFVTGLTAVLLITHALDEATMLSDRIGVMNEGKLLQIAPSEEIYERPANRFVAGFIGSPAMNFLPAQMLGEDEEDGCGIMTEGIEAEDDQDDSAPSAGIVK